MSDNVQITSNTGGTIMIAADEVTDAILGTVKVQYVKIMDGTLNSSNKANVTANGLRVEGAIQGGANVATTAGFLVGGQGTDGNYHNLAVNSNGQLQIIIANPSTTPLYTQQTVNGANVGSNNPVPTSSFYGPSGITPVQNTFTSNTVSATLTPIAGRPFNVNVRFNPGATGSIQLERSFDGGSTWNYLTGAGQQIFVWNTNGSESTVECEVGVQYRLNCTAISGNTAAYRISQ